MDGSEPWGTVAAALAVQGEGWVSVVVSQLPKGEAPGAAMVVVERTVWHLGHPPEEPSRCRVVVFGAEIAPLLSGHSLLWKLSPCWIVELIGNEHFGQLFRYNWHPL